MINETDYVELGLTCGEVFEALDRGTKGKRVDQLGHSALTAIEQLKTWVEIIIHRGVNSFTKSSITEPWPRSRET